jgi:fructosamine-3-kinase
VSGLPPALAAAVERALAAAGRPGGIAGVEPVRGGCINHGSRVTTTAGETWFLKWNPHAPSGMFAAEAEGLGALAAARALRVPEVIAHGDSPAFLLLEHVAPGRPARDFAERLGEGLAALHRAARGAPWGWERDNYIGSLPQSNAPADTWGEFWRDRRLVPQLARARRQGRLAGAEGRVLDRLLERCAELLAPVEDEGPSLLHGDLWGGNVYADGAGRPVLIDPAVHRGHREVDLAMSELFGGFPAAWPRAYAATRPLDPEYSRFRRALYQLYYLLVHVNLFGSGYEAACLAAAREATGSG